MNIAASISSFTESHSVSLTERMEPFLRDADRALIENGRLRDDIAQLENELRFLQKLQLESSATIDSLNAQLHIATKEVALLKARMMMFGEAANIIIAEASKEAKASYVPKPRRAHEPTAEEPTRPVKEAATEQSEEHERVGHLAFLRSPFKDMPKHG